MREYPPHIQLELQADQLEREKRVKELQLELDKVRDSEIAVQIEKFKEVLALLKTDKEIRDLLRESPDLFPLYQAVMTDEKTRASLEDLQSDITGGSATQFCGCLETVRVRWLGRGKQAGEAVLTLGGSYYDLRTGDKIGNSLCHLLSTTATHAVLQCRDPVQNRQLTQVLALQSLPQ